jgi:hypothetical protein
MTTTTRPPETATTQRASGRSILVTVLVALDAVAVLLQGLWAGIFLEHDGQRDAAGSWIDVHARGGEIALGLTVLTTILAFVLLRRRRELWIGGIVLTVLLVLESYVGGLIRDDSKDTLTAVHVPLGMLIMGTVTVLVVRALRASTHRPPQAVEG